MANERQDDFDVAIASKRRELAELEAAKTTRGYRVSEGGVLEHFSTFFGEWKAVCRAQRDRDGQTVVVMFFDEAQNALELEPILHFLNEAHATL